MMSMLHIKSNGTDLSLSWDVDRPGNIGSLSSLDIEGGSNGPNAGKRGWKGLGDAWVH